TAAHTVRTNRSIILPLLFASVTVWFALTACTRGVVSQGRHPEGIRPVEPQPAAESLEGGLTVLYFDGFFRHINELPTGAEALRHGRPGKSVSMIDHRFGSGEVFDSGRSRGVGVQMSGFINFPESGQYVFKARANDGVRVFIDSTRIINDPEVHAARFSRETLLEVPAAGWYPLLIQYFQRKGTAMLELYWRKPGKDKFSIMPAEAYAHLAADGLPQ
ncbi:MAG: hypothetical protein JRJ12_12495, partial [Deltaproteobacteria bacterium]|nr:hypothetical protein [Deltaproteobacteria bacterium]